MIGVEQGRRAADRVVRHSSLPFFLFATSLLAFAAPNLRTCLSEALWLIPRAPGLTQVQRDGGFAFSFLISYQLCDLESVQNFAPDCCASGFVDRANPAKGWRQT